MSQFIVKAVDSVSEAVDECFRKSQVLEVVENVCLGVQERVCGKVLQELKDSVERTKLTVEAMKQRFPLVHQEFSQSFEKLEGEISKAKAEERKVWSELGFAVESVEFFEKQRDEERRLELYLKSFKDVSGLPEVCQLNVFKYLSLSDFASALIVCRAWNLGLDVSVLWSEFAVQRVMENKQLDRRQKERFDPILNKMVVHVVLDASKPLTKESVFAQCLGHVKRSFERVCVPSSLILKSTSKHEDLVSRLDTEDQIRLFLMKSIKRCQTEINEIIQDFIILKDQLDANKVHMNDVARQVKEQEGKLEKARKSFHRVKGQVEEHEFNVKQEISVLEDEIAAMELHEEIQQLKRNRKVLANEVKYLRQSITKAIENRDLLKRQFGNTRSEKKPH